MKHILIVFCILNRPTIVKIQNTLYDHIGKSHFETLYNSVDDNGTKKGFLDRLSQLDKHTDIFVISVHDIVTYYSKQTKGKAVGPEVLIYGVTRLRIHLALLFNCFIKPDIYPDLLYSL